MAVPLPARRCRSCRGRIAACGCAGRCGRGRGKPTTAAAPAGRWSVGQALDFVNLKLARHLIASSRRWVSIPHRRSNTTNLRPPPRDRLEGASFSSCGPLEGGPSAETHRPGSTDCEADTRTIRDESERKKFARAAAAVAPPPIARIPKVGLLQPRWQLLQHLLSQPWLNLLLEDAKAFLLLVLGRSTDLDQPLRAQKCPEKGRRSDAGHAR
jgi:hypothetical protein